MSLKKDNDALNKAAREFFIAICEFLRIDKIVHWLNSKL